MSLDIPFKLLLLFSSFCFIGVPAGATRAGLGSQHPQLLPYNNQSTSHFFNVKTFGAQANGLTDDTKVLFPSLSFSIQTLGMLFSFSPFILLFNLLLSSFQAFLSAWNKACQATGEVDITIPKGTYLVGPLKFAGPCENVSKITVHMKVFFYPFLHFPLLLLLFFTMNEKEASRVISRQQQICLNTEMVLVGLNFDG